VGRFSSGGEGHTAVQLEVMILLDGLEEKRKGFSQLTSYPSIQFKFAGVCLDSFAEEASALRVEVS
jgi:hypothetical protein